MRVKNFIVDVVLLAFFCIASHAQKIAFIGDIHVSDSLTYGYFQKTIVKALVDDKDNLRYCIFLGDLVNETPEWIPAVSDNLKLFNSKAVMGNHDFDSRGREADNAIWASCFGSDNYFFKVGSCHFVGVNDAKGIYPEEAFELVAAVPSNARLVLCQHVPINTIENGKRMMELLKSRKGRTLIMSAHEHYTTKYPLTDKISECIVGSVCTCWWRGITAENGLPYSPSQCGSPRNYYVLDISGGKLNPEFKPIEVKSQMRLTIVDKNEAQLLKGIEEGTAIVNVFGASKDAVVTVRIDSDKPFKAEAAECMDPSVALLKHTTDNAGYKHKDSRRVVYRRRNSPHLWKFSIPTLGEGPHKITIHATDDFGLDVK